MNVRGCLGEHPTSIRNAVPVSRRDIRLTHVHDAQPGIAVGRLTHRPVQRRQAVPGTVHSRHEPFRISSHPHEAAPPVVDRTPPGGTGPKGPGGS